MKAIVGHVGRIFHFFYSITVQSVKAGGNQKNNQQLINKVTQYLYVALNEVNEVVNILNIGSIKVFGKF